MTDWTTHTSDSDDENNNVKYESQSTLDKLIGHSCQRPVGKLMIMTYNDGIDCMVSSFEDI